MRCAFSEKPSKCVLPCEVGISGKGGFTNCRAVDEGRDEECSFPTCALFEHKPSTSSRYVGLDDVYCCVLFVANLLLPRLSVAVYYSPVLCM